MKYHWGAGGIPPAGAKISVPNGVPKVSLRFFMIPVRDPSAAEQLLRYAAAEVLELPDGFAFRYAAEQYTQQYLRQN